MLEVDPSVSNMLDKHSPPNLQPSSPVYSLCLFICDNFYKIEANINVSMLIQTIGINYKNNNDKNPDIAPEIPSEVHSQWHLLS